MKKNYIKPTMGIGFTVMSTLMSASVTTAHEEEAGTGSAGNGVNFSRQGSFWDDSE